MKNTIYYTADYTPDELSSLFLGRQGIYKWTNLKNGKFVVGSSIDLARRIKEYLNPTRLNKELLRGESLIYRAILKYGISAFSFEVLEFYTPDDNLTIYENLSCLRKLETKYITLLQPDYNILPQASSNLNHKLTLETRA